MKAHVIAAIIVVISFLGQSAAAQVAVYPPSSAPGLAQLSPPAHPATPEQIREYFSLTHSVELAHKLMATSLRTSRATSAPYFTAGFWDDMETAVMAIDIVTPAIPAYQKYFSEEDMAATLAFYKSPAGQHLLEAQPFISATLQDVLRKIGEQAGREVGEKHKDEIQRYKDQQKTSPAIAIPQN